MKRFRGEGWALASAIAIAAILPAPAAAGRGHFTLPAMHHSEFTLPASNGYRLQVTETGNRQVYLTAKNGGSSVIYGVRGSKTEGDGIEAKLPGVGRISMRFEQLGRTKHSPPLDGCKGDGSDTERGVFRGTVVFNGERGFARARAHRAGGTVHDSAKEVCGREKEGKGNPNFHTTFLAAVAPRGRGLLSFFAAKFSSSSTPAPEQSVYSASLVEFKGPMSVSRTVSQVASGESFTLGEPSRRPTTAGVAPPSPFDGTASFQLESDSTASWTGPLSVELPGLGPVGFAGPKFSAELCLDSRPCYGAGDGHDASFVAVAVSGRRTGAAPRAAAPSPMPWPR
jgi:hypothetical protein